MIQVSQNQNHDGADLGFIVAVVAIEEFEISSIQIEKNLDS